MLIYLILSILLLKFNIFLNNYNLIFLTETIRKQNPIGNRLVSTGSDLISLNRAVIQRKQSEYKN